MDIYTRDIHLSLAAFFFCFFFFLSEEYFKICVSGTFTATQQSEAGVFPKNRMTEL